MIAIILFLNLFSVVPDVSEETTVVNYLTGHNDYRQDARFVEIPASMAYRSDMYLLRETYDAYACMYQAALNDGVHLKIMSAARTFDEQKWVWEDKWNRIGRQFGSEQEVASYIMQFSAMPGTSRHHWGTDIDLNSTSEHYFETAEGIKVYEWLRTNACSYGFCQAYDALGLSRQTGYQEEKWHWSYYPIADRLLRQYRETIDYSHISGFLGEGAAEPLGVINNYVLTVNSGCGQ